MSPSENSLKNTLTVSNVIEVHLTLLDVLYS